MTEVQKPEAPKSEASILTTLGNSISNTGSKIADLAKNVFKENPNKANTLRTDQKQQMEDLKKHLETKSQAERNKIINDTIVGLDALKAEIATNFLSNSNFGVDTGTYIRAEKTITGAEETNVSISSLEDLKAAATNLEFLILEANKIKDKPTTPEIVSETTPVVAHEVSIPAKPTKEDMHYLTINPRESSGDQKKMEKSKKFIESHKEDSKELDDLVLKNPMNSELKKIQDLIKSPTEANIKELQQKV